MKLQTLNLLKKEIFLGNSIQTLIWIICSFGMFFIPSYPLYVGPFYITLGIMLTFALNQSSHDILYTVLLPVKKIDVVKARFLYCLFLEVLCFAGALIALCIRKAVSYPDNTAGINPTMAYFGLQMILLATFNLLFLSNVYKDPIKPGLRFFLASVVYFLMYAVCEIPVWIYKSTKLQLESGTISELPKIAKVGELLTNSGMLFFMPQLIILLCGLVIFILSWYVSFRKASKIFEKYDL